MPNTFTQMYVQVVFAVKYRKAMIPKNKKEELHKYITGVVSKRGQKVIAIHAMPDHIHILIGIKPDIKLSDLVRDVKVASSQFVNQENWTNQTFRWQGGFGAFTYSQSQLKRVIRYIDNQELHHSKLPFEKEYKGLLDKFEVSYQEEYLFKELA